MRAESHCRSCGARALRPFYDQRDVPAAAGVAFATRSEALSCVRGDIRLALCDACGFIENVLFDASSSAPRRDGARSSSFRDRLYDDSLARRLIRCYDLQGKTIVDLDAGRGDFLMTLCRLGDNRGVGIGAADGTEASSNGRVRFIAAAYSEAHAGVRGDFIYNRRGLERVQPVRELVERMRRSIGENHEPVVFVEVADVRRALSELAFWEVQYDRCSYFSLGSLTRLFRAAGFDVFDLRTDFDGQRVLLDGVSANGAEGPYWDGEDDLAELQRLAAYFGDNVAAKRKEWRAVLQRLDDGKRRTVLWGAGAEACAFLTALDVPDAVDYVVDLDQARHGRYLAGTGHEIVAPQTLKGYRPDAIIATNPAYAGDIELEMRRLAVRAEVIAP